MNDRKKLRAIIGTNTLRDAAKEIYNIGSQGGKHHDATARALGSRMLKEIESSILEEAIDQGMTPTTIARELRALVRGDATEDRLSFDQKKFGIETLLRIGIGGGYAPVKSEHTEKKMEAYLIGVIVDGGVKPESTTEPAIAQG